MLSRLKGNSHIIRLGVRLLLVRQKKKERRGPVKKSDVDTDAEAKEGVPKAAGSVPELKSPARWGRTAVAAKLLLLWKDHTSIFFEWALRSLP